MTQTIALLVDAYRELNAKKLFWITLVISGLVVAAFASVGIDEQSMTFFKWHVPLPGINARTFPPAVFYSIAFTKWGIGFWLSWLGTILALVSTAGIFPDFIAGGSIELTLSKPIGRMRLFLTKYATGLLFVVLQVGIFSAASFLVIGIRGGKWEPRLFLAVPLVTCFFSYLFCICTLLGVLTRSTIASLLLTLLIWVGLWGVSIADQLVVTGREATGMQVERLTKRVERMEAGTARLLAKKAESAEPPADTSPAPQEAPKPEAAPKPVTPPTQAELDAANPMLPPTRARIADAKTWNDRLTWWSKVIFRVRTVLPKTDETTALVKRKLVTESDVAGTLSETERQDVQLGVDDEAPVDPRELKMRLERSERARSIPWILGTSLGFEAIIVGIAGWIFCRRDF